MKTVVISKNFETINIPFGDGTSFTAKADVRQENLFKCLEIIKEDNEQAIALQSEPDNAETEVKVALLMRRLIVQLIGEDSYNELVSTIAGEGAEPREANFAISVLWVEFVELVKEKQMRFASSKAAHYLTEYAKAQGIVEAD